MRRPRGKTKAKAQTSSSQSKESKLAAVKALTEFLKGPEAKRGKGRRSSKIKEGTIKWSYKDGIAAKACTWLLENHNIFVDRHTMSNWLVQFAQDKGDRIGKQKGPKPVLTEVEEAQLVAIVTTGWAYNRPLVPRRIREHAQEIAKMNNKSFKGKSGLPCREWCSKFCARHNLSLQNIRAKTKIRDIDENKKNIENFFNGWSSPVREEVVNACKKINPSIHVYIDGEVSEKTMCQYYVKVGEEWRVHQKGWNWFLKNTVQDTDTGQTYEHAPHRIASADETNFVPCDTNGKGIAPIGSSSGKFQQNNSSTLQLPQVRQATAFTCFLADGRIVPTQYVIPMAKKQKSVHEEGIDEKRRGDKGSACFYNEGKEAKGFQNPDTMKQMLQHLVKLGSQGGSIEGSVLGTISPEKRFLLLVDGHYSHTALEVVKYAHSVGIDIVVLPGQVTSFFQVADQVFGNVKQMMNNFTLGLVSNEIGKKIPLLKGKNRNSSYKQWIQLYDKLMHDPEIGMVSAKTIKEAFEECGIYPASLEKALEKLAGKYNSSGTIKAAGAHSKEDMKKKPYVVDLLSNAGAQEEEIPEKIKQIVDIRGYSLGLGSDQGCEETRQTKTITERGINHATGPHSIAALKMKEEEARKQTIEKKLKEEVQGCRTDQSKFAEFRTNPDALRFAFVYQVKKYCERHEKYWEEGFKRRLNEHSSEDHQKLYSREILRFYTNPNAERQAQINEADKGRAAIVKKNGKRVIQNDESELEAAREKGRQEGYQKGRQEGRQEGYQKGWGDREERAKEELRQLYTRMMNHFQQINMSIMSAGQNPFQHNANFTTSMSP